MAVVSSVTGSAQEAPPSPWIGGRYRLINEIGAGGMGTVFRVEDRLTGRIVTLKRLNHRANLTPGDSQGEEQLELAREFRFLASLRHPNIISVLDYGFDDDHQPYYTMDLQEAAQTLIEAAQQQPLSIQVNLLVQTLRALAYLHRRGILHRDIKPANVLVVNNNARLLDFGLSIARETAKEDPHPSAGTLSYLAPELMYGEAPSVASDIYSTGIVAFELMTGEHPFDEQNKLQFMEVATKAAINFEHPQLERRLRPILAKMCAREPEARYVSAEAVIDALASSLDELNLTKETVSTRESFLQAATFVGRDVEMVRLMSAADQLTEGKGSALLLKGESGIGKSRLLEELRTRVMVRSVIVARGQAKTSGGAPFHAWADIVRALAVRVELGPLQAGVLRTIAPDLGSILKLEPIAPAAVDAGSAQTRLFLAVEALIRRLQRPVVLIIEDLQWAGSESVNLFAWLSRASKELPLLLLGSARSDEPLVLPESIDGLELLSLSRLGNGHLAALSKAMGGVEDETVRARLVDLLMRETEGVPFFVVEVMRALAEQAGALDRIGEDALPEKVVAGGLQRIVQRRLQRVPDFAVPFLERAALLGREVDLVLMAHMCPGLDSERWLSDCENAAIFDAWESRWYFSHDKLREALVQRLSDAQRRAYHLEIAEALEVQYPDRFEALAHHLGAAGDTEREAYYAERAGELSLETGATSEAVMHLERALALKDEVQLPAVVSKNGRFLDLNSRVQPDSVFFARGRIEALLCEAFYRLGDMGRCRSYGMKTLRTLHQRVPEGGWASWGAGILKHLLLRLMQWGVDLRSTEVSQPISKELARVQIRLTETMFYKLDIGALVWSSVRLVNVCEPAGESPDLAQGYVLTGLLAGSLTMRGTAARLLERARSTVERSGTKTDEATIVSRIVVYNIGVCAWAEANANIAHAQKLADGVGARRLIEENHSITGMIRLFTGAFQESRESWARAHALAVQSGNSQILCWGLMGQADALVRMGDYEPARGLYERALQRIDEETMRTEVIWARGMLALAKLRMGDRAGALEQARTSLTALKGTPPVAYWTQHATAATCEVLITLSKEPGADAQLRKDAQHALLALRLFARPFLLGEPFALLMRAYLRPRGSKQTRLLNRAIKRADELGLPYEKARAQLLLWETMEPGEPHRIAVREEIERSFEQLSSAAELSALDARGAGC